MGDPQLQLVGEAPLSADQAPDVGTADGGNASLEESQPLPEEVGHGDPTIRSRGRRPRSRANVFWKLAAAAVPSALALAFLLRAGLSSYPKKIPSLMDLTAVHPSHLREEPKWKAPPVASSEDESHFTTALMKVAVGRVVKLLEAERPATPSVLAGEVLSDLARALSNGKSENIVGQRFELAAMSDLGSGTVTSGLRPFEIIGYSAEDYDSVELEVQDIATLKRYAMVVRLLPSVDAVPLSLHIPREAFPLAEMMHCSQGALQVIGDTPLDVVGREKGLVLPYVFAEIAGLPKIVYGRELALFNVVEFKELVRCDLQSVIEAAHSLPTGWKAHLARGVLKTVLQLQHAGLSHNKINSSSFFVRRDGSLALTSFEASTAFGQKIVPEIAFGGFWTEPRLLAELEDSKKENKPLRADPRSDMWSLGVLLYEILMDGDLPYGLSDLDESPDHVLQIPSQAVPETLHEEMSERSINRRWQHLVRRLLEPDREKRITSEEIVAEYPDVLTETIETEVLDSETFLELFQQDAELADALQYASMIASKPGSEVVPEEFAETIGTEQPVVSEDALAALFETVDGRPPPSNLGEHAPGSAFSGNALGPSARGERIPSDPTEATKSPRWRSRFEALLQPSPIQREQQTRRDQAPTSPPVEPGRGQPHEAHASEGLAGSRKGASSPGLEGRLSPGSPQPVLESRQATAASPRGVHSPARDARETTQEDSSVQSSRPPLPVPAAEPSSTGKTSAAAATDLRDIQGQPSVAPGSLEDGRLVTGAVGPLQSGVATSSEDKGMGVGGASSATEARRPEGQQASSPSEIKSTEPGSPRRVAPPSRFQRVHQMYAPFLPADSSGGRVGAESQPSSIQPQPSEEGNPASSRASSHVSPTTAGDNSEGKGKGSEPEQRHQPDKPQGGPSEQKGKTSPLSPSRLTIQDLYSPRRPSPPPAGPPSSPSPSPSSQPQPAAEGTRGTAAPPSENSSEGGSSSATESGGKTEAIQKPEAVSQPGSRAREPGLLKPPAPRRSPYYELLAASRPSLPHSGGSPSISTQPSSAQPSGEGGQRSATPSSASAPASGDHGERPSGGPSPQESKPTQPVPSRPSRLLTIMDLYTPRSFSSASGGARSPQSQPSAQSEPSTESGQGGASSSENSPKMT
ncbi:hypothetical protein Emag_004892 [Eimeria magna]